jgi:drug/metabolite transporter (DMT)-like permease
MVLNYTGPVIVTALSPLLFRERLTWPRAAALGLALSGVFCIGGQAAARGASGRGLLCAGLSAVSYAAMVICSKKAAQIRGMENAALQMLFALLTAAAFVGGRRGFSMEIAGGDWPSILWLGAVNTGVGCWLYFSSIGQLPVQTVAVCGYLEPLFAVLLSAVFLHESLGPVQLLGAGLIVGGAVLGEGVPARGKRPPRLPGSASPGPRR